MSDVQYATNLSQTVQLKWKKCYSCGVPFGMVAEFYDARVNDHRDFYCPNGHRQHFVSETKAERLARRLKSAESSATFWHDQAQAAERSKAAVKGHLTRIKKRIANGICPCCGRTFSNVARHMSNQHPEFVEEFKAKEASVAHLSDKGRL